MKTPTYLYNEEKSLDELKKYIDSTYSAHYGNKCPAFQFISEAGHGEGFTIGSIIKYAQRYGKKGGKNRQDLLKIAHYALLALHENEK